MKFEYRKWKLDEGSHLSGNLSKSSEILPLYVVWPLKHNVKWSLSTLKVFKLFIVSLTSKTLMTVSDMCGYREPTLFICY